MNFQDTTAQSNVFDYYVNVGLESYPQKFSERSRNLSADAEPSAGNSQTISYSNPLLEFERRQIRFNQLKLQSECCIPSVESSQFWICGGCFCWVAIVFTNFVIRVLPKELHYSSSMNETSLGNAAACCRITNIKT